VSLAKLQQWAKVHPDLASVFQQTAGGSTLEPTLSIANDVMTELVSQAFNWKWNSTVAPFFYTNGFQQDYALNIVSLGWLEYGIIIDINNTALPKPIWPLECVKWLPPTSVQYGMPGQVAWFPNNQLIYGTWGAANTGNSSIGGNPQPNQVITSSLGVLTSPPNPILQVKDAFGNLWVVTGFGVTGATNPFLSNLNPVYPTSVNPNQVATTVNDGTVIWTAVNPLGMGIRCNPTPPQLGVVYQFYIQYQYRAFAFSNGLYQQLSQTIEPVPDDFSKYFKDGFFAYGYLHSSDKGVRAKFQDTYAIWQKSLMDAKKQGDRERDNAGFYPAQGLLQGGSYIYPGPAYPYPLGW
jgi:hypothetical protein